MSYATQIPQDLLTETEPLCFLFWLVTLPGDLRRAHLTMQLYTSLTGRHFGYPEQRAIRQHFGRRDGT